LPANCWAHSPRKLHDICQSNGFEIAAERLRRVARLDKLNIVDLYADPREALTATRMVSARHASTSW
jgi:hypothetical protein